ncbi:MAG: bi-domain-containing oxidoreductase [Candidatus Aenigmarchaeota archaeon]|nr:bi-domain-containing oxidoreductase [Candidatus Aenigmarchaeota archaeon]
MKQVLVNRKGEVVVKKVPVPTLQKDTILVRVENSLISSGTETRSLVDKGLPAYIKRNPGTAKSFLGRMLREGMDRPLMDIRTKLKELTQVGYNCSGTVIECGSGVDWIEAGDRVACAGGEAHHAEIIAVPKNLVVRIPGNVSSKEAAFVSVGGIALHAVRTARASIGDRVLVIGLGLVGQIVTQILKAAGATVIGVDVHKSKVDAAKSLGMDIGIAGDYTERVLEATNGVGADAAIICAATASSKPVNDAIRSLRDRGSLVIVGVVGMDLEWGSLYAKEISLFMSRSYGPGRYDALYERKGVDYPISYVRWTENRNMEEFLNMVSRGAVKLKPLITAEFAVDDAPDAYQAITESPEKHIAVLLNYKSTEAAEESQSVEHTVAERPVKGRVNIAVIGTGSIVKAQHLPNIRRSGGFNIRTIVSNTGVNAGHMAEVYRAARSTTNYKSALRDKEIEAVLIATPNKFHAGMAIDALSHGKHVFVEKPLAMTYPECRKLWRALKKHKGLLTVGFNRRFSPLSIRAKEMLEGETAPKIGIYRVNVTPSAGKTWIDDPELGGGRILEEVCHFFDFFSWIFGEEPIRVYAEKLTARSSNIVDKDNVVISVKFSKGSIASIIYSCIGNPNVPKESVEIFSSGKVVRILNFQRLDAFGFREKGMKLASIDKGHYNHMLNFLRAIKGEEKLAVTADDGIRATVCCLKTLESLRSSTPQKLDWKKIISG